MSGLNAAAYLLRMRELTPSDAIILDFQCGLGVPLPHVVHRGIREHHTPAERVVRLVALDHLHPMRRVQLFHQEPEIETRRTTTNADYVQGLAPDDCWIQRLDRQRAGDICTLSNLVLHR
jgi:hypothetical protein